MTGRAFNTINSGAVGCPPTSSQSGLFFTREPVGKGKELGKRTSWTCVRLLQLSDVKKEIAGKLKREKDNA